jgi:hypothetical protein
MMQVKKDGIEEAVKVIWNWLLMARLSWRFC